MRNAFQVGIVLGSIPHYLNTLMSFFAVLEGDLPRPLFLKKLIIGSISLKLRKWSFSFRKIQTLDVKNNWDEVDEEKANHRTIDVNNGADADLEDANQETNANHKCNVDDLGDVDLSSL